MLSSRPFLTMTPEILPVYYDQFIPEDLASQPGARSMSIPERDPILALPVWASETSTDRNQTHFAAFLVEVPVPREGPDKVIRYVRFLPGVRMSAGGAYPDRFVPTGDYFEEFSFLLSGQFVGEVREATEESPEGAPELAYVG